MSFSNDLKKQISKFHLLDHPFYKAWVEGGLQKEQLKHYAKQYHAHVDAFPRYISAVHSNCTDSTSRKVLLENLNEEEGSLGKPHPELWMDFAEGLGINKADVLAEKSQRCTKELVETFHSLCRSSYAEGLAAIYAYEYQVPEIAETKIEGLKKHFDVHDEKTLSFFKIHQTADIVHREQCEELLDQLPLEGRPLALAAAEKAASTLWDFLTEVYQHDLDRAS